MWSCSSSPPICVNVVDRENVTSCKREKVADGRGETYIQVLHNIDSSPSIIRAMRLRWMKRGM
jgi:hypothetical protein